MDWFPMDVTTPKPLSFSALQPRIGGIATDHGTIPASQLRAPDSDLKTD